MLELCIKMQEYRQLILLRLGGGWGHKNYTLLRFFPNNFFLKFSFTHIQAISQNFGAWKDL